MSSDQTTRLFDVAMTEVEVMPRDDLLACALVLEADAIVAGEGALGLAFRKGAAVMRALADAKEATDV